MELLSSFLLLPLLGVNNYLRILNMYNNFVCFHNKEECINEFSIGYMVNPALHVNKVFKEKV